MCTSVKGFLYEFSCVRLRVLLSTNSPEYEFSWVRVLKGTTFPEYEFYWVRVFMGTTISSFELRVLLNMSSLGYEFF